MTITAATETITPSIAEAMLGYNSENRNINHRRVAVIRDDILADRWEFNGDAIRFDENGIMIDGQHRLAAIVMAGKSVASLVVRGVPVAARKTIDQGKSRSLADVLKIERGLSQASAMSTTITSIMIFEKAVRIGSWSMSRNRSISIGAALDWYDAQPDEVRSVMLAGRRISESPAKLPLGSVAPTLFGAMQIGADVMEAFANEVQDGDGGANSATTALREYGIKRSQARDKPSAQVVALVTVRAFNRWITGAETMRATPGRNLKPIPVQDETTLAVFPQRLSVA